MYVTSKCYINLMYISMFTRVRSAAPKWLSWLEHPPRTRKGCGFHPRSGEYGRLPIYVSLSHRCFSLSLSVFLFLAPLHSLSPPFSLSSILSLFNKYILRRGLINKKVKYKSREVTLPVFCISRNILYYICMYIIYFCLNIYISAIYIYSNRYPTKRLTTL